MNQKERDKLQPLIGQLEEIHAKLDDAANTEQDKFDNMAEGLQQSERGQKIEQAAEQLRSAADELESVISNLTDALSE